MIFWYLCDLSLQVYCKILEGRERALHSISSPPLSRARLLGAEPETRIWVQRIYEGKWE